MTSREKLIERLPVDDAILILREELKQRADAYYTHIIYGGKGDPAEEVHFDALEMAISALEQTKWISVSDPPKEKGCYLVNVNHWWDGKPVAREAFWNGDDWLSCYDKFKISQRVTHWMPLPEPPKGE